MLSKCQEFNGFTDEEHEADDDPFFSPSRVRPKRPRVYVQNVPVYASTTHMLKHVHTETF